MSVQCKKVASGTSTVTLDFQTAIVRNISIYAADAEVECEIGSGSGIFVPSGSTFTATEMQPCTNVVIDRSGGATVLYVWWW